MKKLWVWNWVGGGYNSTWAETKEEALAKAKEIGSWTANLLVDEATLRESTEDEESKLWWENRGMLG
ncbi:MAG: hypothetical protein ACREGR_00250 [Minisyncoccia bacterium]